MRVAADAIHCHPLYFPILSVYSVRIQARLAHRSPFNPTWPSTVRFRRPGLARAPGAGCSAAGRKAHNGRTANEKPDQRARRGRSTHRPPGPCEAASSSEQRAPDPRALSPSLPLSRPEGGCCGRTATRAKPRLSGCGEPLCRGPSPPPASGPGAGAVPARPTEGFRRSTVGHRQPACSAPCAAGRGCGRGGSGRRSRGRGRPTAGAACPCRRRKAARCCWSAAAPGRPP